MRWTVAEVLEALGTELPPGLDPGLTVVEVITDSRRARPGTLFVPLVDRRDGHDFIDDARRAGTALWLSARPDARVGAIAVAETQRALTMLGSYARERSTGPVIGITGSSGKTSTKDLLASVLRGRGPVTASEKSFNNELGVPLTLCNGPDDAWAAVVEMGARGPGHIAALCEVARPDLGIVTNIGTAHLELFRSRSGIAAAKGELIDALPAAGTAVLNRDDDQFDALAARAHGARVLSFGLDASADVRAEHVRLDDSLHAAARLRTPWGDTDIEVGVPGRHQLLNALAAAGAALAAGGSLEQVSSGLAVAQLSPWRMELHRLGGGALVLNDAYNANPSSMRAALAALLELPAQRRIAVLGTMAEIGPDAPAEHRAVAALAAAGGVLLVSVAEPSYEAESGLAADDVEAATELLLGRLGPLLPGDAVLVKGSRVAGLERVAQRLLDADAHTGAAAAASTNPDTEGRR